MKLPVRDLLELAGLLLLVVVVWLATGLVWATVLAAAAVLLYLSHAWLWEDVEVKAPARRWRSRRPEMAPPIVTNRRLW